MLSGSFFFKVLCCCLCIEVINFNYRYKLTSFLLTMSLYPNSYFLLQWIAGTYSVKPLSHQGSLIHEELSNAVFSMEHCSIKPGRLQTCRISNQSLIFPNAQVYTLPLNAVHCCCTLLMTPFYSAFAFSDLALLRDFLLSCSLFLFNFMIYGYAWCLLWILLCQDNFLMASALWVVWLSSDPSYRLILWCIQ